MSWKIGQTVTIMITGMIGDYSAEVLALDSNGFPSRLKVVGDTSWNDFTLKPGDFIIQRERA